MLWLSANFFLKIKPFCFQDQLYNNSICFMIRLSIFKGCFFILSPSTPWICHYPSLKFWPINIADTLQCRFQLHTCRRKMIWVWLCSWCCDHCLFTLIRGRYPPIQWAKVRRNCWKLILGYAHVSSEPGLCGKDRAGIFDSRRSVRPTRHTTHSSWTVHQLLFIFPCTFLTIPMSQGVRFIDVHMKHKHTLSPPRLQF